MTIEIKVPVLPESVSEATMLDWHKQPGDAIKRDENLVDIETDKVVLEVPAPVDGVLQEIRKQSGDVVGAQQIIGVLEAGAVADSAPVAAEAAVPEAKPEAASDEATSSADSGRHGPAVTALLAEHNLGALKINGTGKDGRITKEDVQRVARTYFTKENRLVLTIQPPAPAGRSFLRPGDEE